MGLDGASASQPLMTTTVEPEGVNCEYGGIKVEIGLDTDGDMILSANEVTETQYLCNGQDGQPGVDGERGLKVSQVCKDQTVNLENKVQ